MLPAAAAAVAASGCVLQCCKTTRMWSRLGQTILRSAAPPSAQRLQMTATLPWSDSNVVIMDGAMGTELAGMGVTRMGSPGWTVRPHLSQSGVDAIKEVHTNYLKAGAKVICTHTYNLCELYCQMNDVPCNDVPAAQRRAVEIARDAVREFAAADDRHVVAAVLGPYGAAAERGADYCFDYSTVDVETLKYFHRRRATVLLEAKPSVLLFETLSSLKELQAIVAVLDELEVNNAWVAFTCGANGVTAIGDAWCDIVRLANSSARIEAIGVNCCAPPIAHAALLEARSLTRKPLIAYPNNATWDKETLKWEMGTPEEFARWCERLTSVAKVVGGCCGSAPADIAKLTHVLHGSLGPRLD